MIRIHDVYESDNDQSPSVIVFPGGEPHVQLDPATIKGRHLWVDARVRDAAGFMQTLVVLDAVRGCNPARLGLMLPYFPGARQDRRTAPGTPFTLDVVMRCIRPFGLDCIAAVDPHSSALDDQLDARLTPRDLIPPDGGWDGVIAPDDGSVDRAIGAAARLGLKVVYGNKKRDPSTGKLSGFQCDSLPTDGRYLVVDDICDGGGTFIGLAKAIRAQQPNAQLDLWVTHGIFSKGIGPLLDHFDRVYTTDSFPTSPAIVPTARLVLTEIGPMANALMRKALQC